MAVKEGYDVLRLIEHGKTCYISSEYVEGRILAEWIKSYPDVEKEQLFLLIREIMNQLSMIHKCRKKPYYQYVNPYSIVVTEEGKPYFLDMEAGSNEKRLRFMQRRTVRECFLPKEEAYYQKGSINLDIYGSGKTIQYLFAAAAPKPSLNRREERRFLKIISKCLNYQSRSSYQSAADIRRCIPQYKKKTEHRKAVQRTIFMAAGAASVLAAAWKLQAAVDDEGEKTQSGLSDVTESDIQEKKYQEDVLQEVEEVEAAGTGKIGFGSDWLLRGGGEAYMELALAYILDLSDYEKSLYYLEQICEYVPARDLTEIVEAFCGEAKEPSVLEESLIRLEDEAAKDATGRYYRCLVRGYGLLDTKQAAQEILRLGRLCMSRMDREEEGWKEIQEAMVSACEKLGESKKAAQLCEELLGQETDSMKKKEIYEKTAVFYTSAEQPDQAVEVLRRLLEDPVIEPELCVQAVQEYIRQMPGILENEEFRKLMEESGIVVEGDQIWAGQ